MAHKTPVYPAGAVPGGAYSPAVISGDFVFVSGQLPRRPGSLQTVDGDIKVQTRQVLENLRQVLEAAGCTLDDVVKVSVHLADLADFAGYDEVYRESFREPFPARTTVQGVLRQGSLIELDVIAHRPRG